MKKLIRFISFILSKIIVITLVFLLCAAGFMVSMNVSNLYVMLNDGMKERANVILYNHDTSGMSKYFTSYFMENDEYLTLREKYSKYRVNTYGYNLQIESLLIWPWATNATIYVNEAVYSIDGAIDTTIYDKDQAMLSGTYYPPQWQNYRYKVTLIKSQDGLWHIEDLEAVSTYDYTPPQQQSLPPEVLASLRPSPTPKPSPTATPRPLLTPTVTPEPTYKGTIVGVNRALNVRSGPGTNYDKIGELQNGVEIDIYTMTENWYCFDFNGTKAYVHMQYVKLEDVE